MSDDRDPDAENPGASWRWGRGRHGVVEYFAPDWKPGDPPSEVVGGRQPSRNGVGRPSALTAHEARRTFILAVILKDQCLNARTGNVIVNKLAREVAILMFGKDATAERIEHVRSTIREATNHSHGSVFRRSLNPE
jgi:hypothetical protein